MKVIRPIRIRHFNSCRKLNKQSSGLNMLLVLGRMLPIICKISAFRNCTDEVVQRPDEHLRDYPCPVSGSPGTSCTGRLRALALYDAIILAKPDLEEDHANKGVVLRDMHRFEASLASFNRAIELNQDLAEAYSNKGFVLTELGELTEALANLDRAERYCRISKWSVVF